MKRASLVSVGFGLVVIGLTGCGLGDFSSNCKIAINTSIDLRNQVASISGGIPAPCGMGLTREDAVYDACGALGDSSGAFKSKCEDDLSAAFDAVLLGQRQ